ncbi:MAG: homoserine kinase [Chloroflexi bacterium]|nr:homoserine kinase [Chloroflexota bacterium]
MTAGDPVIASGPVTVDVPASSANLGAGFDALALALDLADIFTVTRADDLPAGSIEVTVVGEGADVIPRDGSDRFSQALRRGLAEVDGPGAAGVAGGAWRVRMHNAIPVGRGLGSSAAATVGGLAAADLLFGGGVIPAERMLELATWFEGHPDNVAAALHGGFTVAVPVGDASMDGPPRSDGAPPMSPSDAAPSLMSRSDPARSPAAGFALVRFELPPDLLVVLFVPDRRLSTGSMREILPESVPRRDAVHNVARASLAVAALASGRLDLLAAATEDRLHEPYRASVFPELPRLIAAARGAGALGACLSGAGSSILAFADRPGLASDVAAALELEASTVGLTGRAMVLRPRSQGVIGVGSGQLDQ